ncbi:MAG: hypothetical protein DRP64_00410 [Verrucomicrobia bacterium]|nr:MAG: hypothetical protein DRP64_00410 [Verrucomicrobiota bacterium]
MASLKDIATSLDLSIPLVSKVLNGKLGSTGCSETKQQMIFAKAKELNYRPNLVARSLRDGRTGSIGVFVHPLGAPGSDLIERLLMGISARANQFEQRLCLSFFQTDREFLNHYTATARSELDGLLLAGVAHPKLIDLYEQIERNGVPIVTLFRDTTQISDNVNIYCSDFQIGYLPTRHLLENSCRRIAHIHSFESRYQGYCKALEEKGIQEDPSLVYTAIESYGADTGKAAVQHWINNGIEFDGLVAESDHQAFGAINELLAAGRRVPEDVKVFGADDSPICDLSPVPLSSVSQQLEEVGSLGIETLMKRINNKPVDSALISPALCLRASTGN